MLEKSKNFRNVILRVFGATLFAFLILLTVSFYIFYDILIDSRNNEINIILKSFTNHLHNQKEQYDYRAFRLASVAKMLHEFNKNIQSPELIKKEIELFLKEATQQQPLTTGLGIWFEPFKFDNNSKYFGPYCYWNGDSIKLTYDYSTKEYDYFNWEWYQNALPIDWNRKVKRPKNVYWSKVFYDTGATKETMISIASPFYSNQNEIIGVVTIDFSIKKLLNLVEELKVTPNSHSFIIQKKSKKIINYTLDSKYLMKDYKEVSWMKGLIMNNNHGSFTKNIVVDEKEYRIYYSGEVDGLIHGMIIPDSDFYKPLWNYFYLMIFVALLALLALFFITKYAISKIWELANRNSELYSYFFNIMNTSPDAIIILDEQGNFVDVNDSFCGLYEYSKDESKNLNVGKISKDEDVDEFFKEQYKMVLDGEDLDFDWIGKTKSGIEFPALIRLRKMAYSNKNQLLSVITDMTEIIAVESELKQLNSELEERVDQRTIMLQEANFNLELEINERKRIENNLRISNEELVMLNQMIADDSRKLLALNENLAISEQQLRDANFTKDKFFSIIAHDLKNPIHALKMNLDFLSSQIMNVEKSYSLELVKSSSNAVNFINELLENLLLWARTQTGRIAFCPSNILLYPVVQQVFELYKSNTDKKKINTILEIDFEFELWADENMIKTVIRNLVSNSIKFTPENGRITVTANRINNNNIISVIDTGIGLSEFEISILLNAEGSQSTLGTAFEKGSGLGILICREFIEFHDGRIEVESKIGKGSKFNVILPCK